jgi:hypothetical protein
MHEALIVHELQSPQNRRKHRSHLLRRERSFRKNLAKTFFRALLHNIKQIRAIEFAASRSENANQIWMVQFAGKLPSEELLLRVSRGRDQLDDSFFGIARGALHKGKEHSAMIGTAQVVL